MVELVWQFLDRRIRDCRINYTLKVHPNSWRFVLHHNRSQSPLDVFAFVMSMSTSIWVILPHRGDEHCFCRCSDSLSSSFTPFATLYRPQTSSSGFNSKHCMRDRIACTQVPEAETSTHRASLSASHRGAATPLLHQSELDGGSVAERIAGAWSGRQALCTRVAEAETSTHHETMSPWSATHRGAAASLLHQSELDGSSVAEYIALCTPVPQAKTSTHLASLVCLAPWSSHTLAASVGA